ncbi:hypothetical protein [Winogradskyella sp. R77965]|uniref:hypothetical protein n=1 Tax=Winogradskyella sp. R77965 TaxID=3093872 RepID=UPI0037DD997C
MHIENSDLASQVIKKTESKIGSIHYFNHIAVLEFNEGVHIDINSVKPTLVDILDYFGNSKPFGIIVNRIYSYSVSILDIKDARQALPNLSAYGIVAYSHAGKMNAKIESSFCEWKNICFNNLHEGIDSVYQTVKKKIAITLN